jgi:hypothetical protein
MRTFGYVSYRRPFNGSAPGSAPLGEVRCGRDGAALVFFFFLVPLPLGAGSTAMLSLSFSPPLAGALAGADGTATIGAGATTGVGAGAATVVGA